MLKRLALISTFSTAFLLSGCALTPKDGLYLELPEPRPVSAESSYAMKVATAIQTTARCLGCKDTVLWQDEKAMASSARFHELAVTGEEYDAAYEYWARIRKLNKAGKLTKDNLPPAPKVVLNQRDIAPKPTKGSGSGLTNGLMLANSFDGRWSNPGSSLGAGLALGLLFGGTGPDNDENRLFPPPKYMKLAFVLPEKIPFQKFNYSRLTDEENERENASCYGAAELVRVMSKSAIDMGYKPVGELQYDIRDDSYTKKPYWAYVYQPLENDSVGCPKVTPESDRKFICRVEYGRYNALRVRHSYTYYYSKDVVPAILGGDGQATRWIAHMGYHLDNRHGLIVDEADDLTDKEGDRNYRHVMGMQKYLKPGQFVYVPSYYLSNEESTAQCVLDHKGVHYFAVVVPENRPAPVAPVPSATEAAEPADNAGFGGWLNRVTNF